MSIAWCYSTFLLFIQSSHSDCFTVSCSKTYEFCSVTLIVARKALSSSVRTQFFGTTSFSSLMKLRSNLGNSSVVNGDIDSSGIFVIMLVVNPTGFRRKDKVEAIWNIPWRVFTFFSLHLSGTQVANGVLLFLSASLSFSKLVFSQFIARSSTLRGS